MPRSIWVAASFAGSHSNSTDYHPTRNAQPDATRYSCSIIRSRSRGRIGAGGNQARGQLVRILRRDDLGKRIPLHCPRLEGIEDDIAPCWPVKPAEITCVRIGDHCAVAAREQRAQQFRDGRRLAGAGGPDQLEMLRLLQGVKRHRGQRDGPCHPTAPDARAGLYASTAAMTVPGTAPGGPPAHQQRSPNRQCTHEALSVPRRHPPDHGDFTRRKSPWAP